MDMQDIFKLFLDESIEYLEEVSNQLMLLEENSATEEIIQVLFRSAHTLKGNSTTAYNTLLDFDADVKVLEHIKNIGKITHVFENMIMEVRDNGLELTSERLELLFEIENVIETLLSYVEQNVTEPFDIDDLHDRVQKSISSKVEGSSTTKIIVDETINNDKNKYKIVLKFDSEGEETFKHAFLSMVYVDIRDKYDPTQEEKVLTFEPSFDFLMNGSDFTDIYFELDKNFDSQEVIDFVSKINNVGSVTLFNGSITEENNKEVVIENVLEQKEEEISIPKNNKLLEEAALETGNTIDEKEIAEKINNKLSKIENNKNIPAVSKNLISNTNIRVDIKRIDEVLKHVSSLVILKNKLSTYSSLLTSEENKILKDVSEEISQTVDFLQDSVMKIRMTPLDQLFQRFPKDVRNIAKEYNKKVQFIHTGGATEIDKSLLDNLGNPLIHLIRNSVFHGIESEEERIASGKDPIGKLILSATHEQGTVVITIEDDGKGIDVDKVVKKAIEKGYITEEKAKSLTEDEAVQLIFASGLSTADKVTNVAGRGVGMDAVKATIEEEMRGTVQVYSTLGQGTKTVIKLPLTLAIINAMRTKINGLDFAFPTNQVEEVVAIYPKEIKFVANKEIYILRDKEIPIIRLDEYFGMDIHQDENKMINLVLLKLNDKTVAVTVDEFIGQEDIVVKTLGKHLGNLPGISGCNILGDGSISLIVDINTLIK